MAGIDNILKEIKSYKKIDYNTLSREDFETKSYITEMLPSDARLRFKIASQMVPNIKMNFKNDPKFKSELYKCDLCQELDTQEHLRVCKGYSHLRDGKDLMNDLDLVTFFKEVLIMRDSV